VRGERSKAKSYDTDNAPYRQHVPLRDVIALLKRDEPSNDFNITAYNYRIHKQAIVPLWANMGPVSMLGPPADSMDSSGSPLRAL
tara:strand:+ start:1447 stop:1701 length:255 start_codon:yes stop_codon:yes gene_type:complete